MHLTRKVSTRPRRSLRNNAESDSTQNSHIGAAATAVRTMQNDTMSNDGEDYPLAKRQRETPSPPGSAELKKPRVSPAAPSRAQNGLPPMSHSFIGVEPVDEFILEIADWIHGLVTSRPPGTPGKIEVEAKLGLMKYHNGDTRIVFPVRTETST